MPRDSKLLGAVRRRQILEKLKADPELRVSALAEQLDASPETIRRDLRALEQAGHLTRVHGGAVAIPSELLPPVNLRRDHHMRAKAVIADLAAREISSGSMVFLGASSTTLALAAKLIDLPRTTFVTNMIDIALVLGRDARHDVHVTGGQYRETTRTLGGPEMLKFLDPHVFDLAVFGITAVDLAHGFMGPTDWHVAILGLIRRKARRLMVVCDSSKFGRTDRYRLLGFEEVDTVVTDRRPGHEFLEKLAAGRGRISFPSPTEGADADSLHGLPSASG